MAVIVIDFDNTIVEERFPNIGELKEGAKAVINSLYFAGHEIVINTCRAGEYEGDAVNFLKLKDIHFHYINCNLPRLVTHFGQDCRKISGDIYIDDKNLGGLPGTWLEMLPMILTRIKEIEG